jgi:hypothetical protein
MPSKIVKDAAGTHRVRGLRYDQNSAVSMAMRDKTSNMGRYSRRPRPPKGAGRLIEAAVVVIETMAVVADVPVKETVLGEMAQVELVGAPLHVSRTLWLKPAYGVNESVYVAVAPGVTVAVVVDPADREKSGVGAGAAIASDSVAILVSAPALP